MLHSAILTLDLVRMAIHPAIDPIELLGSYAKVDVEYAFLPAAPGDAEGRDTFTAKTARLRHSLLLRDESNSIMLLIDAGRDILGNLTGRQLDWIEENLPKPAQ